MFGLGLAEVLPLEVEIFVGVHGNIIHALHQLTEVLLQNSTEQRMMYLVVPHHQIYLKYKFHLSALNKE